MKIVGESYVITNKGLRIISNFPLTLPPEEEVEAVKFPNDRILLRRLVSLLVALRQADCCVFNMTPLGFWLVLLLRSISPIRLCPIVSVDILLPTPQGIRGRVMAWLKSMLLCRIDLFLLYFKDTKAYERHYRIDRKKIRYIPFKINAFEFVKAIEISDQGFICVAGQTRRDFATLVEALGDTQFEVRIVCPPQSVLKQHGSLLDESSLPSNFRVIRDDGAEKHFLVNEMAKCRIVVLPIMKDTISASGISVYIQAMAMRKCVVISQGPAVNGILSSKEAVICPSADPAALKHAVSKAFNDRTLREGTAESGFHYAMSLGGEQQLFESIINTIRASNLLP